MSQVVIRPYRAGDELGMAHTHARSILEICSMDYPAEVVVKWAVKKPEKYARKAHEGENFWIAEVTGNIVGLAGWQGDDLTVCYIHPEYTGKGIARALFGHVEKDFREKTGKLEMRVESTLTARAFYEKMGFRLVGPHVHIFHDGVTKLDCLKMVKSYAS